MVVKRKRKIGAAICVIEKPRSSIRHQLKSSLRVVVVQRSTLQFISTLPLDNSSCAVHALILIISRRLAADLNDDSFLIHFYSVGRADEIVDYEQETSQVGHDSCFVGC